MEVFLSICGLMVFLLSLIFVEVHGFWQENVRPKKFVQLKGGEDDVYRFQNNETYSDRFRYILQDGQHLLVGAKNIIFNLSLSDLTERRHIYWKSEQDDSTLCYMKGIDEKKCHNYIRIIEKLVSNKLFVCGTNAFKPKCRILDIDKNYTVDKEFSGIAVNPFDPDHNSTSIYIDGFLYTGTMADFSGIDPVVYKKPLFPDLYDSRHGIPDPNSIKALALKTEQYDSMSLNFPNFVSSMAQGDFIYFFFREVALEHVNCGKTQYSRVARVCRNDQGGTHRFQNRWTSFLKARLNCSVPGEYPFYFDEIVSTSPFINGVYGDEVAQLVYAVFTTPSNSISGSAICAFSLKNITDVFDGNFKEQSSIYSNWLAVPSNNVPDPRPGSCHSDSRTLPDLTLNFIRTHTLLDLSVPPFFGQPILIHTGYRFTKIAIDGQVKVPGNRSYDVLFIGTDNGKVIKAINGHSADSLNTVSQIIIEEIQVFPNHLPVRNLHLIKANEYSEGRLIITTDTQVTSIKLHRCNHSKVSSCSECVALQDPYCAWDKVQGKCSSYRSNQWDDSNRYYQDVSTGSHIACPKSKTFFQENTNSQKEYELNSPKNVREDFMFSSRSHSNDQNAVNHHDYKEREHPSISATDNFQMRYAMETLILSVIVGASIASVVGFVAGYLCGRKCHKDDADNLAYPETEYEYFEQRPNLNRFPNDTKLLPQEEVTYAEPILLPQPTLKNHHLHSPKNSMRKLPQHPNNHAETLFQFQNDNGYTHAARDGYRNDSFRRLSPSNNTNDGYSTTRSVKKVYL